MDFWPSFITAPSSISGGVDDPYIEAKGETGDDSARPRFSAERMTPFKLSWKAMPLAEYKYLEELFYPQHRAVEFLWQHPSQGKTYVVRFVSSPVSSSEDGTAPFVASVEVQLQPLSLSPDSQAQPSIDDLMRTINEGADRAVDAATSAADSRDKAAASATAAKKSETAAAASAKSAETSASTATSKASEAAESAVTAGTKAGEASASAAAAKASETAATASEASAAASATTATDKADEAATSATTASTKAGEASASAATAKTSETNAASSAGAAATSASTASTKASAAATSATKAKTSETNAASSATDAAGSAGTATAKAEEAAASAVTATTKAGEAATSAGTASAKSSDAAKSATAAKASETNALASKNAAALSAESAEADRIAAEAARDEAQDLANVGYVSEGHAGLAKVDGKTTQADASGVITVKDVAIGGNLEDLASARGYLVDEYLPEFPSRTVLSSFDDATTPGNFHVLWNNTTTSAPDGILNKNQYADGVLEVRDNRSASFVSSFARLMQRLTIIGGATRADSARIFVRTQSWGVTREWFPWVELVSYNKFGDGFRNTNGIISVPEYEGATASSAGTSGLVPPAAAGQHESFLTGGGEYKPALSTGGGVMTGSIQINDLENAIGAAPSTNTERGLFLGDKNSVIMGGFDVIQRASDNAKYTQFYSKNSSGHITSIAAVTYEDGTRELVADSPLQINDIQIKQVVDGGRRVIVLSGARGNQGHSFRFSPDTGEAYMDGRVIHAKADTAGYADTAGSANALGGKAESALSVAYARDSGAMNGKAESALSVNYANSAGQVYLAGSAVQWVVNLSGPQITVPLGGTYNVVCICFNDSGGKGAVKHYPNIAGGTVIPNAPTDYMVAGLCARVA